MPACKVYTAAPGWSGWAEPSGRSGVNGASRGPWRGGAARCRAHGARAAIAPARGGARRKGCRAAGGAASSREEGAMTAKSVTIYGKDG